MSDGAGGPGRPEDGRWLELVEGVVHGLRTPLATVSGYLELLGLDPTTLDERQRDHLARAAQGARELGRQIELVQLVARFEAGAAELRPEERPLASIVDTALLRLGEDERARIVWRERAPGAVRSDPGLLGRAAAGLLARALARSGEDEAVEIAVVAAGGRLRLEVRDRGAALAPAQVADLFGAFGRAGERLRSPRLELYLARLVAEASGGEAGAGSAGGVTTSWIGLPAA